MRVILFGPPGSGKGTQAAILREREGLAHLSTGNMFRAAIEKGTRIGMQAKIHMDHGNLVPDEIVWRVARHALEPLGYDSFVLDGYPRTIQQAHWLDAALAERGGQPLVVSLEVPDEIIIRRLSGRRMHRVTGQIYHLEFKQPPADISPHDLVQRPDDMPDAIKKRLEIYHGETSPVKEHYRKSGVLFEVDGVGGLSVVTERIQAVIANASERERSSSSVS